MLVSSLGADVSSSFFSSSEASALSALSSSLAPFSVASGSYEQIKCHSTFFLKMYSFESKTDSNLKFAPSTDKTSV